jgi:hypothetical protein
MKEKLLELKQIIYRRLPARWGLKKKVQQITSSASEIYEIKLQGIHPDHFEMNNIRQIILLNPYTIPTRPVEIRSHQSENGISYLEISFTVMNKEYGKQIERSIHSKFNPFQSGTE